MEFLAPVALGKKLNVRGDTHENGQEDSKCL
jgi:hypothetical protein